MANENNLKPIRSVNEAREKGKKGGKKSGEIRAKNIIIVLHTKSINKNIFSTNFDKKYNE